MTPPNYYKHWKGEIKSGSGGNKKQAFCTCTHLVDLDTGPFAGCSVVVIPTINEIQISILGTILTSGNHIYFLSSIVLQLVGASHTLKRKTVHHLFPILHKILCFQHLIMTLPK